MRGIDCLARFPFRYFDDRAVAGAHDHWLAIGHKPFFAQSRHTIAHECEQFVFFPRFRAVDDDHANA